MTFSTRSTHMNQTNLSIANRIFAFAAMAFVFGVIGASYNVLAQGRELSLADILIALRSKKAVIEDKNKILTDAVKERGITFALTPEIEKELGVTGARVELIAAIREKAVKPKSEVSAPVKTEAPPPVVKPVAPPPDFAFYRVRATQEMNANNLDAALADLDKAIEMKPGDAGSFVDKGIIFTRQDKLETAIEQYTKAIELNANYGLAYFNRGMVKERMGRGDDALVDFQKAADVDPNDDLAKAAILRIKTAKAEAAAKVAEAARLAEAAKRPTVINVGALNSYAAKLAMPVYSPVHKRMGLHGKVTVTIKLDEEGKVISVKAIDGPKPLWSAAEEAIKQSKFKPVLLDGKPIAANGMITFNFSLK